MKLTDCAAPCKIVSLFWRRAGAVKRFTGSAALSGHTGLNKELTMTGIDNPQLTQLVNSARASAEHPGYVALQPIIDLLEAAVAWLIGKRGADRTSVPPL
jgi:hypothetical protein